MEKYICLRKVFGKISKACQAPRMYSFRSIVKDRTEVQRREIPALVLRLANSGNRHTWTVSSSSLESSTEGRYLTVYSCIVSISLC